jgi:predicted XRE-type DNA-binding protein
MNPEEIEVEGPFDNVFAALGLSEPDVRQAKNWARIALREAIAAKGLTQREAAERLGMPQSNLARALGGSASSLTWDKLFGMWTALGGRVQVSLIPDADGQVVAEGPGMLLPDRLVPPATPPAAAPKKRRQAAERTSSAEAKRKRTT